MKKKDRFLAPLITACLAILFASSDFGRKVEEFLYDHRLTYLTRLRPFSFKPTINDLKGYDVVNHDVAGSRQRIGEVGLTSPPPPSNLAIVALDDVTFDIMAENMSGLKWPYPRAMHAKVIRHLAEAGARALFLDIIFDLESGYGPADDDELADAVGKIPVVLAGEDSPKAISKPLQLLLDAGAIEGNAYLPFDSDGVIRRMPGAKGFPATFLKSLEYWTGGLGVFSQRSENEPHSTIPTAMTALFTSARLPETSINPGFIHYFGAAGSISAISYFEVYDDQLFKRHKEFFKDKIVLIGRTPSVSITPTEAADTYLIPIGNSPMPGVEIHAHLFGSILSQKLRSVVSPQVSTLWLLIWVLVVTVLLRFFVSPLHALLVLCGALFLFSLGVIAAFQSNLILPVVPFVAFAGFHYIAVLGARYIEERDGRLITRAQLFRYLPERVAKYVLANPQRLAMAGDRQTITILFADIAGFTTLSEKLPAEVIMPLLQTHLEQMTAIIFKHEGTLDKYLGDGIMAFWGAPEPQKNHAELALYAAQEMLDGVESANEIRREQNMPELHLRIGLHTGEAIVGNIGSKLFIDYTAIGDCVNLASRLEGANKSFGTKVIISEAVATALGSRPTNLVGLGRIAVIGKEDPIGIYTLSTPSDEEYFVEFKRLLDLISEGRLDDARESAVKLTENAPLFGPAQFFRGVLESSVSNICMDKGEPYVKLESK